MDPLTAFAQMVTAFCNMVTEIIKGQPPEIKARQWERSEKFMDDVTNLFKPKP